jgi:hypothetical protein
VTGIEKVHHSTPTIVPGSLHVERWLFCRSPGDVKLAYESAGAVQDFLHEGRLALGVGLPVLPTWWMPPPMNSPSTGCSRRRSSSNLAGQTGSYA